MVMPRTTVPTTSRMTLPTTVAPRTAVRPTRETFLAICMPYERDLFAMAMRYTHSNADAADLVQETLMRAMTAWERFETGSNARAWLQRILTNTFINGYRKRRRHQRFATECPGDARQALHGTDLDYAEDPMAAQTSEELGPARRKIPRHRQRLGIADRHRDVAPISRPPPSRSIARTVRRARLRLRPRGVAAVSISTLLAASRTSPQHRRRGSVRSLCRRERRYKSPTPGHRRQR